MSSQFTGETHRLLVQMAQSQARVEEQVKALVKRHDDRDAADIRRADADAKLEGRVRKLEYHRHRVAGTAGAIGSMVGAAMTIAVSLVTGHTIPLLHK